jgi:hypothetical protein
MTRQDWNFTQYMEEIFHLSEIQEIPGIASRITVLINEVWLRYPDQCEEIGLRYSEAS